MAAEGTMASYMVDLPEGSAAAKRSGVQTEPASPIQAKPVSHATSLRGTVFAQYIHDVIDGKSFFDPYAADASWMRAILAIGAVQSYFHEEKTRDAVSLVKELRDVPVDLDELGLCDARIRSFFEECIRCLETDTAVNTLDRVAGADEELSRSVQSIPTMASQETLRYYKWLARTLEHPGDIVELGSWMGSTTACLAEGLSQNLCRKHTRIHAYDSFIWRDWMRTYTEDPELPGCKHSRRGLISRLFPPLYGTFAPPDRRASISIEDSDPADCPPGNRMECEPIAILVMDFAHDRASNEAMWHVFSPSFQSGSTIVIFNQYGNIPAGDVREFCRDKAGELVPLHKPRSSAKAFRYQKAVA
jgi:hypothetical protein